MIKHISSFIKVPADSKSSGSSEDGYEISRDLLARMIAAHTSGKFNADPEMMHFEIADEMIAFLSLRLNRNSDDHGPCPRCGGDHSWCQNVQPGEFG